MWPLSRLPLPVLLVLVVAVAMLVPAFQASALDHHAIARNFLYSALLSALLAVMVGMALGRRPAVRHPRRALLTMALGFILLPLVMAVPLAQSLPDTGILNAWWEMVSSMTTTGASLYAPERLPAPLHLWRGLSGWLGGLFVLISATGIMLPLRLGGFELTVPPPAPRSPGPDDPTHSLSHLAMPGFSTEAADPGFRLARAARAVVPAYAGVTLVLWVLLLILGDDNFTALMRAMGTVSTSGISPVSGPIGAGSGLPGEAVVLVFLLPALSRRFWPGGAQLQASPRLRDDPELRVALLLVGLVASALFLRHFLRLAGPAGDGAVPAVIWGAVFNGFSFLTTTGWNSAHWQDVQHWSGLSGPGLLLAGLAMMGGGVATAAGGVKLLRVHALARHGQRQLERIIHPASVGGGGPLARHLRGEGAYLAFIFFMLFAVSIAGVVVLVSLHPINLETATVLSIAALSNTGQLAGAIPLTPLYEASAGLASAPWAGWSGLPMPIKVILALAMILGRIETLAALALLSPEFWRR